MCRRSRASSLIAVCVTSFLALVGTSSADTRQIKIKGYVTNVVSPTQFEIEDYRITRDTMFALEFDNDTPELRFRPEDIKVGVELEIKGTLDESIGTLHATSIKVDLEQFKKAKHTAIIAYPPVGVTRDGSDGLVGSSLTVNESRSRQPPRCSSSSRVASRSWRRPQQRPLTRTTIPHSSPYGRSIR